MNELVSQLTQKVGISESQAQQAIEVMKNFIQSQLPPMMQGMVDNFMQSNQGGGDANKSISDLMG